MDFWELESQLRSVALRQEYVVITGGLAPAILLSQLVYWFKPGKNGKPKLTIIREGKYWLAKSRSDWFNECGLSLKMYKGAIVELVELGLVELRHWKFGNDRTSHYWLDTGALAALLEFHGFGGTMQSIANSGWPQKAHLDGTIGIIPMAQKGPSECDLLAHPIYTETTAENTAEITYTVQQAALGFAGAGILNGFEEGTENMVTILASKALTSASNAGKKADEVLAGMKAKKESAADTSDALRMRWIKEYAGVYGKFDGHVTVADKGKLGRLAKLVGKEKALALITHAVREWQKFAIMARDQKGLGGSPERPVIGFLLQHYDVASQSLEKASKVPTMADGKPYFTVKDAGWGGGWKAGEVIPVGQSQKGHPGEGEVDGPKGATQEPVQSIANPKGKVPVAGPDDVDAAMKELGLS